MNIVLPEGYRHVVRIRAGHEREDVHIVVDQHAGRDGYVATTLCGIDVDTKHKGDELLAEWGTLPVGEKERQTRQANGVWFHDCDKCVAHIRTAAFITERLQEAWRRLAPYVGLDEQVTPARLGTVDSDFVQSVVEDLMANGVIR